MKRYLPFLFFLVFACHSLKTFCQEEFYGNHSGISLAYLQGLNAEAQGLGLSVYSKLIISHVHNKR